MSKPKLVTINNMTYIREGGCFLCIVAQLCQHTLYYIILVYKYHLQASGRATELHNGGSR